MSGVIGPGVGVGGEESPSADIRSRRLGFGLNPGFSPVVRLCFRFLGIVLLFLVTECLIPAATVPHCPLFQISENQRRNIGFQLKRMKASDLDGTTIFSEYSDEPQTQAVDLRDP